MQVVVRRNHVDDMFRMHMRLSASGEDCPLVSIPLCSIPAALLEQDSEIAIEQSCRLELFEKVDARASFWHTMLGEEWSTSPQVGGLTMQSPVSFPHLRRRTKAVGDQSFRMRENSARSALLTTSQKGMIRT